MPPKITLLEKHQARSLTVIYKVLGNDTRLRLLYALLQIDELWVTDLGLLLGMSATAVSNQLKRLTDFHIVSSRRAGTSVLYRLVDKRVRSLLHLGLTHIEAASQGPKVASK